MDKTQEMTPQFELEKQLHEQYAINNNANVSSFVAMIGSLLVAFTGYGYVVYQYLMGEGNHCCCQTAKANIMLALATIAVLVVIFILYMVAIEIGASQRTNQFVIYAIRKKAYGDLQYNNIFPKGYEPFNKNFFTFVQGIYNTLSWIFLGIYVIIAILSFCVIKQHGCCLCCCAILGLYMISFRYSKFTKYKNLDLDNNIHWAQRVIFPVIIIGLCVWGITLCAECTIKCLFAIIAATSLFTIINIYNNSK